jgi:N-acetyl-gamma-glutamyl-phosphate reductase / acetylglutamate kinase
MGPAAEDAVVQSGNPLHVAFIPVVAPWFSGTISTPSVPLKEDVRLTARDVRLLYERAYEGEKAIKLLEGGKVVDIKDIQNKHGWVFGGAQVASSGQRVVVVGGLDNLLKGAATQCLQVSLTLMNGGGIY